MISGRSVLALIPARGGSRRLPGKNIRALGGKPLIAWSIDLARSVQGIDEVLVSTDDADIAKVAKAHGASVPWLRPAEYATDTSPSSDAIVHAIQERAREGRSFDIFVLLQPTSPFRSASHVREAIELCIAHDGEPVVDFAPARSHPGWCFTVDEEGRAHPLLEAGGTALRSQDLAPVVEVSGSLYAIGVARFLRERTFFSRDTRALVLAERHLALDIDDEFDWMVAEAVLAHGLARA
ncbi:MAG TPA: acylneuraminate cytidylyltransferase family protein [Ramlibacter sp.]|uniref:acylneuraminate cytidylyltransferase family protein n=1 Tax=Ramlibacter sp. TaxID=1917967 RepID=UPI002D032E6E|nr:acylneuraminate cytidylyltransferase family protein [Ramlibacter sp.]HVZ45356.1 acylneuraminate cytidylyltransferase family protein [Ramlibacter sp.]